MNFHFSRASFWFPRLQERKKKQFMPLFSALSNSLWSSRSRGPHISTIGFDMHVSKHGHVWTLFLEKKCPNMAMFGHLQKCPGTMHGHFFVLYVKICPCIIHFISCNIRFIARNWQNYWKWY